MTRDKDEDLMRRALELAGRGRYSVSPNPMVGCVLVRDGRIIGEGFHERAGEPHAEVRALLSCSESPRGATAYITLEPCAHHGRTPPCTNALIEAGIAEVVVAAGDPNRLVDGRGIEALRAAGISVRSGVLASAAARLNEKFIYSERSARPFVLLKAAMSLDGKLATRARDSHWITGEAARERSLLFREEYDAILVGSGTIETDDPHLTRRLGRASGITPWTRVVVHSREKLAPAAHVFDGSVRTIVFSTNPDLLPTGTAAEIVRARERDGVVDLGWALDELGRRGIQSLIAEGGSGVHTTLIEERLWQKMALFVAPLLIGGASSPSIYASEGSAALGGATRFVFDEVEKLGDDILITAYPR
jgi:diaminohydroxyphosphoribosylaminopyrimidine deaminase / 5-amino-6-(5-phosphoribosylamino)uracil reductase